MLIFLVFEIFFPYFRMFQGVPISQADQGVFLGYSGFWGVPAVFQGVPFRLLFRILQTPLCGFAKLLFGLSNLLTPVAVLNFLK